MSCIHIKGTRRVGDGASFLFTGKRDRLAEVEANAQHANPKIRSAAASSPHASEDVLWNLAHDEEVTVREWVARNTVTPFRVLFYLSRDTEPSVRGWVAWNPRTPDTVVNFLLGDEDASVRGLARTVIDNKA